MADDGFVLAYKTPTGEKRRVPRHYLDNPSLGFKAVKPRTAQEPATPANITTITEPAKPGQHTKEVAP